MVLKEESEKAVVEDIVIQQPEQHVDEQEEKFIVAEDLKETAKTAIPTRIENIAKKFSARAVKKEPKQNFSDSVEDTNE